MSKPYIHARSSARKFGGKSEDYLEIHNFMDSSKALIGDNRHRALFHTTFGIFIVEKIFGVTFTNSDGKVLSTRSIAEQHCLEDYGGFIPTVSDFFNEMEYQNWMHGKGKPPSMLRVNNKDKVDTD